ncbi:MAG: TetR/AcrR family transcriptional regulator [Solirubrobacteraceae bacterium]
MVDPSKNPARRGRPARYTRDQVVRVALTMLENEQFKPLTFRGLADELGLTPMAIYGYVKDMEDLLQEASRTALDEIRGDTEPTGAWHAQIRTDVTDVYRLGQRYPNLVSTALAQNLKSPLLYRIREHILDQLARGGFDDTESLHALGQLLAYSLGFAASRARYDPLPPLPADAFPRLTRIAHRYDEHISDTAFQDGLDRLIESLKRDRRRLRQRSGTSEE